MPAASRSRDGQRVAISSPLAWRADRRLSRPRQGAHARRSARPDLVGLAPTAGFAATTGSGDWLILDGDRRDTDAGSLRGRPGAAGDNHMVALRTA